MKKHIELEKLPIDNLFTVRISVQGNDVFYQDIRADSAEQALHIAAAKALNKLKLQDIKGGLPWRC